MNDDFNTAVVVAHLNEESRGIRTLSVVLLVVERGIRKTWLFAFRHLNLQESY